MFWPGTAPCRNRALSVFMEAVWRLGFFVPARRNPRARIYVPSDAMSKIHALVDAAGRPIRLKLTEGQAHDGRSAADMFETVEAGHILLADRAYDSAALRNVMAERGAWANIRAKPNRVKAFPFSPWGLPPAQRCRTLLQQTQTLQSRRNPLRQARRLLPRFRPTRLNSNLAAKL